MDSKDSSPVSLSLPQLLRHRNPIPDVPEDVDYVMQHLNDPNWDLSSDSLSPTSTSFELDEKRGRALSSGYSTRSSDFDSESQADSTHRAGSSRVQFRQAVDEYEEDSPYAEVRAAVSNIDDPSMPVNTFRMWFLGIIFTVFMSGLNHFYSMRYPSVNISALVIQLIALPCGKFLEYILPRTKFNTFGYVWSLNPGPFNIKEHAVITVMANAVYSDVYATTIFMTQQAFYGQKLSFGYQILLSLSTQLLGYSAAGFIRQFVVWPASMIWPGALVNCALLNTLHKNYGLRETKHISRERFFVYVVIGGFLWYFVPGFLFTGLSVFNWVCWIAPTNQTVNTLFGYSSGLGMGFLTFDWSMISWIGSPLVTPWWAEANILAGFLFFFWFVTPIAYFKNAFYSKYMPISSIGSYDNTGAPYDVSAILTNGVFDEVKYRAYSPLFISTTFAISYGVQFAAFTAVVVHTFLWYRHDIMRQLRRTLRDERDVHSRLMMAYPEVPRWWYGLLGLVAFVLGVVSIEIYPTQLPVWALVFAVLVAFVFIVPVTMIRAITNQQIPLNILSELLVGYSLPGRPVAMMIFKTFGFVTVTQSTFFASDLKLGHYMKVPPRIMFLSQTIATTISAFVCVGVQMWAFSHIENVCTPLAKDGLICPQVSTFATAATIWGGIGPQRLFSPGKIYNFAMYFFLLGAILPIPFYLLARRYPHSKLRYVNVPVMFAGLGQLPPATGINYSSWATAGFFFQWFMRRFHFRWWMRYNYILSAALDSGVAISIIFIFFCLEFPKGGVTLNWWGNTVWQKTFDAVGMPALLPPNGTFGPATWD
ncbi:OPT oligopeptide transporter [Obba rivulosa]|uniref:OPT oligopeptide transporter n=1 Tax=Obba rivulosa TaxID=1052685 RepID=A0A8E2ASP7_9APHY|nr:OPT oligopeptide transporter [Obba rivulosa]